MVGVKTPKTSNYVPASALGVDSKILDLKLKGWIRKQQLVKGSRRTRRGMRRRTRKRVRRRTRMKTRRRTRRRKSRMTRTNRRMKRGRKRRKRGKRNQIENS